VRFRLSADFIEHIHDVLIGTFLSAWDEKITPNEYRNRGCIESAINRPFQTAFGGELWPSIPEKAASLFHSLACNHCFINGNKRTAVIGLDLFLAFNGHLLTMSSEEVYAIARETAEANERGRKLEQVMPDLSAKIAEAALSFEVLSGPKVQEQIGEKAFSTLSLHLARISQLVQNASAYGVEAGEELEP
jgi:death-on-curing family protein